MRSVSRLLGGMLLLGGCEMLTQDSARLSDCDPWRAGCPILIDFSDDAPAGGTVNPGRATAGVGTTGSPAPPALPAPDSLSVPASERSPAVLAPPPELAPGSAPSAGAAAPAPPVRTTYPSFDRSVPRVWVPGQPTARGYRSPGARR